MGDDAYVIKSANAAHACARFESVSSRLTSHTFVVHVRRATVGLVDHVNAHPFRFGRWLFAHNGTLFDFDRLRPWLETHTDAELRPLVLGDTDSEHLFYFLLSRLAAAGLHRAGRESTDALIAGRVVRESLLELDAHARSLNIERPIVNVLLTDGRLMVAHKAGMPLYISTQKRFCADFDTCPEPSKVCMEVIRPEGKPVNHLLVASERIGGRENLWEDLADGTTVTLTQDFRLAIQGPPPEWVAPEMPERFRRAL